MIQIVGFHAQVESPKVNWAQLLQTFNYTVCHYASCLGLIIFSSHLQHRREIRLAAAARVREKQMVKEMQKMKRTEAKEDLNQDVTEDVFVTPAEDKPVHIETEAPKGQVSNKNKRKALKRQKLRMTQR